MFNATNRVLFSNGRLPNIDNPQLAIAKLLVEQSAIFVQNGFDPTPFVTADWLNAYNNDELYLNALEDALVKSKLYTPSSEKELLQLSIEITGIREKAVRVTKLLSEKGFNKLRVINVKDSTNPLTEIMDTFFDTTKFTEEDFLTMSLTEDIPRVLEKHKNLISTKMRSSFTKITRPLIWSGLGQSTNESEFPDNSLGTVLSQFVIKYGISDPHRKSLLLRNFGKSLRSFTIHLAYYFEDFLDLDEM